MAWNNLKKMRVAKQMMANMLEERFPGIQKATGTSNGFDQLDFLTDLFRLKIDQRVSAVMSEFERVSRRPSAPADTPEERERLAKLLAEVASSKGIK